MPYLYLYAKGTPEGGEFISLQSEYHEQTGREKPVPAGLTFVWSRLKAFKGEFALEGFL